MTTCDLDYTGDTCSSTWGQATAPDWLVLRWIHVACSLATLVLALRLHVRYGRFHLHVRTSCRYEGLVASRLRLVSSSMLVIHGMINMMYWTVDPNRIQGEQVWSSGVERAAHFVSNYYAFDWSIVTSGMALQALWAITPSQQVRTWRLFKYTAAWIASIQICIYATTIAYQATSIAYIGLMRVFLLMHVLTAFGFAGSALYGGKILLDYIHSLPPEDVSANLRNCQESAKAHRKNFGPAIVIFCLIALIFGPTDLMTSPTGWKAISVYLPLIPQLGKIGHIQLMETLVPKQDKNKKPQQSQERSANHTA